MPRAHSWRRRIPDILMILESAPVTQLGRQEVEVLFGVQRRAALRLMEAIDPSIQGREWRLDRLRLIAWVSALAAATGEDDSRSAKLRQRMKEVAGQKLKVKAELRSLGRPGPASWALPSDAFTAEIKKLPLAVALSAGNVTVTFPPESPATGAKLLHQLSLAMLSDWQGFCACTGLKAGEESKDQIDRLLGLLETEKEAGIEEMQPPATRRN